MHHAGVKLPSVTLTPAYVHSFENGSFTMECESDHYADALLWEKEGYAIDMESSRFVIKEDGTTSSLTVMDANKDDSGVYFCVAESEEGVRVNASATVMVTESVLTCDGKQHER